MQSAAPIPLALAAENRPMFLLNTTGALMIGAAVLSVVSLVTLRTALIRHPRQWKLFAGLGVIASSVNLTITIVLPIERPPHDVGAFLLFIGGSLVTALVSQVYEWPIGPAA